MEIKRTYSKYPHREIKRNYIILFISLIIIFSTINNYAIRLKSKDSIKYSNNKELEYSLDNIFATKVKIRKYNNIAHLNASTDPEKSIEYAHLGLNLSTEINWEFGIASSLNNIGEAQRYIGNIEGALQKHDEALAIYTKLNNKKKIAETYNLKGLSYFNISDFPNSMRLYNVALKIFTSLNDENNIVITYGNLGLLFDRFNQNGKALEYFNKALVLSKDLNDTLMIGEQLGNIGLAFMKMKDYQQAESFYNTALDIFEKKEKYYLYSKHLGNLGTVYANQKLYKKAHYYFYKALNYAKEINDKYGIARQYGNIGELSLKIFKDNNKNNNGLSRNESLDKSIYYLKKAMKNYRNLGTKDEHKEYLFLLSEAYEKNKDYRRALVTYRKAKKLEKEIYSSNNNIKIAQLEINQQLDLKEKKIEILNKDKEYNSYVIISTLFVATIFFVGMAVIVNLYRKKGKQNEILHKHIQLYEIAQNALQKNEKELKQHQNRLEHLVKVRTKKLEDEIVEHKLTEENLMQAKERAEIASNAKSVFLANMSHELRTPLVGILGYSDLLTTIIEDEDQKEMAEGINRTGNRLLSTLSLVLDLARIESDRFEIDIRNIDVINELKEITDNFKGIAAKKKLDLVLDVHSESYYHKLDVSMIKVVFENLINNAIKFTQNGEVRIKTCIESYGKLDFLDIKVIDTGVGINEKDIPQIFEEFKQLSEGFTKDFQGSGLGLSITKKFVKLLGGTIIVSSEPGEGSTFILRFPINQSMAA